MAIGTGWVDGAWVDAGWASDAWASGGADVTAPSLSSPTGAADGATGGTGSVSTDEGNGTLWWVVTQSATTPSVAQIQAAQNHLGAAADDSGNQAVSGTGAQGVTATGLTAETAYYFHYQQEDAATNDSTAVSSTSFTTDAETAGGGGTGGANDLVDPKRSAGMVNRFARGLVSILLLIFWG